MKTNRKEINGWVKKLVISYKICENSTTFNKQKIADKLGISEQ